MLRTQTLRFWRKSEEGVDLTLSKQLDRFDRPARHPFDVLGGIEFNQRRHRAKENVGAGLEPLNADGSTLQIGDTTYALPGEQLETADMNPGQNSNAQATIDLKKKRTGEMQGEVDVSLPDCFGLLHAGIGLNVNDICKPLGI